MFCSQCGASLLEGSKFCLECGAPVSKVPEDASEPVEAPAAEPPADAVEAPASEPVADAANASVGKPAVEPIEASLVEPAAESVETPAAEPPAEPLEASLVESDAESVETPAAKSAVEPVETPTKEPAEEPAAEPAVEPTAKSAVELGAVGVSEDVVESGDQNKPAAALPQAQSPQPGTQPPFQHPQPGAQPPFQQPQLGAQPSFQHPQPGTQPPFQHPQPGAQPPSQAPQPWVPPATVLGAPKKSKKPLFITLGIAAAVIVLAIAAAIGFDVYRSSSYSNAVANLEAGDYQAAYDAFVNLGDYENAPLLLARAQNGLDYNAAQALLDAEDYEGALAAFDALKGFKDSVDKAALCQNTLDYRAAIEDFEAGDLEAAFDAFSALTTAGFSDSAEWADKTAYAIADQSYEAGDHYAAYQGFKELGSYKDAAERMQQCTTPYPETGEYYHNEAYVSTSSAIVIDAANASYASYYKIYSGSDLVSAIFLNPGASHMTELPPGNYTLKEASGDVWFGEEIMFGDEGYYDVLVFDDGNDYFTLDHNVEVTITLSVASGDIKSSPTDREDF